MRALTGLLLIGACTPNPEWDEVEPGEWLVGGDTTNIVMTGRNSFLLPAAGLTQAEEQDFFSGNGFFNQAWVEAPASTQARDGLGPLFNARSCSGCHFRDGRAAPPETSGGPLVGLLIRLSVPGATEPIPHPVYGGQFQDQALPDVPVEGQVDIQWTPVRGSYADGTSYTLTAPTYTFTELAYGPMGPATMTSPRIAPAMPGLGLLEAIPEADILATQDPNDIDGDGISGVAQFREDGLGRFGWKGDATSIPDQVAHAFNGDLGLTTPPLPLDDCTDEQVECRVHPEGGNPEIPQDIFDLVVLYSRTIAPPARRQADDPTVLAGKRLFHESGCADCHTPSHQTGEAPIAALSGQTIWPYTDLLLHDMGPDLADGRAVGMANGSEWRTPPLWSLGLTDEVSGHTRFLHDGRARSLTEAVLWHGGEALGARDAFRDLNLQERDALITFVNDL